MRKYVRVLLMVIMFFGMFNSAVVFEQKVQANAELMTGSEIVYKDGLAPGLAYFNRSISVAAEIGYSFCNGEVYLYDQFNNKTTFVITESNHMVSGIGTRGLNLDCLDLPNGKYKLVVPKGLIHSNNTIEGKYVYNNEVVKSFNLNTRLINDLIKRITFSSNEITIIAKEGSNFQGTYIYIEDQSKNKKVVEVLRRNPDIQWPDTQQNEIKISNLNLVEGNYEIFIPVGLIVSVPSDTSNSDGYFYNSSYRMSFRIEDKGIGSPFSDVSTDYWAYPAIRALVENGVINGYEDGQFKPNDYVSRNEFGKIMVLALKIPLQASANPSFVDVLQDSWELPYVEAAKKYLTGYQDGKHYYFKGNSIAVREDMAVALVKALRLEDQLVDIAELQTLFSDSNTISPLLQRYVLIAYKNKLVDGYPDKTFGAQKPITRAETASLLIKVSTYDKMQKVIFE